MGKDAAVTVLLPTKKEKAELTHGDTTTETPPTGLESYYSFLPNGALANTSGKAPDFQLWIMFKNVLNLETAFPS